MAESKEELKSFLIKVKEESGNVGLKFNIQKTKVMATDSITSWQIDGKQWLNIFLSFKITADGDFSHEIKKKKLTPWKESYDQPRWQMVMITLYAKQKKRHRCIEQIFGLCGRRRGWDVLREQHQNMYII